MSESKILNNVRAEQTLFSAVNSRLRPNFNSMYKRIVGRTIWHVFLMVLVDGDRHGDGYVTPIYPLFVNIVMSKQDFGSTYQEFLVKVHTYLYIDFTETDWSAQQLFA